MKKLIYILITILLLQSKLINPSYSDITDKLIQLDKLYKNGSISMEEYEKAKKIVLQMEQNKEKKVNKANKLKDNSKKLSEIEIRKYKDNVGQENMELMEMNIGDFRIYSHRPGGIKVRRISDGKQLLVISENLKINYYNESHRKKIIRVENNEDKLQPKLKLFINDVPVLSWEGKYVSKFNATFYQIFALGNKPFQYYIKLSKVGSVVGLNMNKFDRKIDKAVAKAKTRLAAKYNISIDQINSIMRERENKTIKELEGVVKKEQEKVFEASLTDVIEESVNSELAKELQQTIGDAMANELINAIEAETGQAIDAAVQDELSAAIDEAIAEAVAMGIDEATAAAALQAAMEVWARGGSDAEAYAAAQAACGGQC